MRGERLRLIILAGCLVGPLLGCSQAPEMAAVEGRVTYNGEPLKFGMVLFQNATGGQPASGLIQPDGSFKLTTPKTGDGAKPGQYNISVYCYESQDPAKQASFGSGNESMGKLLVPKKYIMASTSGLTAEIKPETNEPIILELTDK